MQSITQAIRHCIPCGRRYLGPIHCPRCGSADTSLTLKPTTGVCTVCGGPRAFLCPCIEVDLHSKTQATLFAVPAPPKPNLWRIETRWRRSTRVESWLKPETWTLDPEKNVWRPWLKYDITIEKSAQSKAKHSRQVWPWQSFRVVIAGYEQTPGFDNGEISPGARPRL